MHICFCRKAKPELVDGVDVPDNRVNDGIVKIHLQRKPQLLGEAWDVVSKDITGRAMVCGQCENQGNECLGKINAAAGVEIRSLVLAS